jgi:hypothetical protein
MDPDSQSTSSVSRTNMAGETGKFPHIEGGHHYLVLYPNMQKLSNIYYQYIMGQIEEQPDSVILVLPYYLTSQKVREILNSDGIQVSELERKGSLVIVDIEKVINSSYFELTDVQGLEGFTKYIENSQQGKPILVVADMSVFKHLDKPKQVLEYERTLHKEQRERKWKELCLYNERDFKAMFTQQEINELLDYHKDKVVTV